MASSDQDFYIKKAMAWRAYHTIKRLWNATLDNNLKIMIFKVTIETILLYESETWTIDKKLRRKIDGCYIKLLRMVLNVSWRDKISNKILYNVMPLITDVIAIRRMRIAGHCLRHNDKIANNLILWGPKFGRRNRRRHKFSYIDNLNEDTDLNDIDDERLQGEVERKFVKSK